VKKARRAEAYRWQNQLKDFSTDSMTVEAPEMSEEARRARQEIKAENVFLTSLSFCPSFEKFNINFLPCVGTLTAAQNLKIFCEQ